jgi:hypothetical protein
MTEEREKAETELDHKYVRSQQLMAQADREFIEKTVYKQCEVEFF